MKNAKPTKAKTAKSNKRFYRKQVRSLKRGHVKPLSLIEKMPCPLCPVLSEEDHSGEALPPLQKGSARDVGSGRNQRTGI